MLQSGVCVTNVLTTTRQKRGQRKGEANGQLPNYGLNVNGSKRV